MNEKIAAIYRKIKTLEDDLEREIQQAGEKLSYRIVEKRVLFESQLVEYHRRFRKTAYRFLREASLRNTLTAPVTYGMIAPLVVMDVCVTLYQWICFPAYGIKKVPRGDFIMMDRHHLEYLNVFEKLNCAYCGYANGLAGYFREIAARTEEYWCPIKHARRVRQPHSRYHTFVAYEDAKGYRKKVEGTEED